MTWTVVYEDVGGAQSVPYNWKNGHEYKIIAAEKPDQTELSCTSVYTIAESMLVTDAGYMRRTNDGVVLLANSPKSIQAISQRGGQNKIIQILERPLPYQLTVPVPDNDEQEGFHRIFQGDAQNINIDWEYDCEYIVFVRRFETVGSYNNRSFCIPVPVFLPAELMQIPAGAPIAIHGHILWGDFFTFNRVANNPSQVSGRTISMTNAASTTRILAIYKRRIKITDVADGLPNRWRRFYHEPNGMGVSGKWKYARPFPWPDNKDFIVIHTDDKGTPELTSANFYNDSALFIDKEAQLVSVQGWNRVISQESANNVPIAVTIPSFDNRGYKCAYCWISKGSTLYSGYERLEGSPNPPTPPVPSKPPCEECLLPGNIWYQDVLVPVQFISPPDWDSRVYTYEWGGDIGNGQLYLQEVLEDGRVARLRFVIELAIADDQSSRTFNIECLVKDVIYSSLGIEDTATANITFMLPCVVQFNNPDILVEDITVVEQDVDHTIQQRIFLSEPYIGPTPLCVDWATRDGTAVSDLSVRALARDDLNLPFITVIENNAGDRRMYLDGAFPKYYNGYYNAIVAVPKYMNTLIFTKNIINWLSGAKTGGAVLLMGDFGTGGLYDVKDPSGYTSFRAYFQDAATQTGRTLTTLYGSECTATQAFFDGFDCVIYISSLYTDIQVNSPALIAALKASHFAGQGVGLITDHGEDWNPTGKGYYKGANEFLFDFYQIKFRASIERQDMILTVEDAIAANGNHPLWTGMTGQINSGESEAYVDAIDQEPDYISASGQVCFNSGDFEKFVPITILGETLVEGDEYFEVVISNNTQGTIVKSVGQITITDDDASECGVSTLSGGEGITETIHNLGMTAGTVAIAYDMDAQPDMMEVFYNGSLVATTGGFVSNTGVLTFSYAGPPGPTTCMVRMTGSGVGTSWEYTVGCPTP